MSVAEVKDYSGKGRTLGIRHAGASEPAPFDAMEKAIHEAYEKQPTPTAAPVSN
ncbi:MAG: hypothetical protein IPJ82_08810 [Lewinellaceae bacterium]|nr:hypothetical protein [Lewinellaceae bacterium]